MSRFNGVLFYSTLQYALNFWFSVLWDLCIPRGVTSVIPHNLRHISILHCVVTPEPKPTSFLQCRMLRYLLVGEGHRDQSLWHHHPRWTLYRLIIRVLLFYVSMITLCINTRQFSLQFAWPVESYLQCYAKVLPWILGRSLWLNEVPTWLETQLGNVS